MEKMVTDRIRKFREDNKWSQSQMADKIGVHRKTYNKIEQGKMSLRELIKICELFNLTLLLIPKEYL